MRHERQGCLRCGRRTDLEFLRMSTPRGYYHFWCYSLAGGLFRRADR